MASTPIERLRYYDLEYLRAFDFAAEQLYHLEMRRRLNLALHLRGIVAGLDLVKSAKVPGVPDQYYINPGIAIDAYGREILLAKKYLLGPADLQNNKTTANGDYPIWIAYQRQATTPPGPGYVLCNVKDQLTRWQESYQILIGDVPPVPSTAPQVFDPLSDDPQKFFWPLRLGTITAGIDANGTFTVISAKSEKCEYIGLRAQRILAPLDARPTLNPNILNKNSPHVPPTSVCVESNLFAQDNAIIGRDFLVDQSKFSTPPPSTPPFPSPTGNLKVASDLFLQGNLYAYSNAQGQWLGLSDLLKPFIPDVQVGFQPIPIAFSASPTSKGDVTISVTTNLPTTSNRNMVVSISSIKWNTLQNLQNLVALGDTLTDIEFTITNPGATQPSKKYDFNLHWEITPSKFISGTGVLPTVSLTVMYVAVFYP
jgi:hypothetical protein